MRSHRRKPSSGTVDSSSQHLLKRAELLRQTGFEVELKLDLGNHRQNLFPVFSCAGQKKSGSLSGQGRQSDGTPADIQFLADTQGAPGDALDLFGTEFRDNRSPLADSSGANAQRPRDIRGLLKVIDHFGLEHVPSLSVLKSRMQAQSQGSVLTSVDMEKLNDFADRLADAMKQAPGVSASALARECRVTPTAVHNWLTRKSLKATAENYEAAGRALGVRAEWLRTGKLPRERDTQDVQIERLQAALRDLREPLAALLAAVDELTPSESRKRHSKS